jgi:predicted GNAT family N-acyltransferase
LKVEIKEVTIEDILPLRQEVLRNGKPLEECFFDGDSSINTIHLALFINKKIIGAATLLNDSHKNFTFESQIRLRGMAIKPNVQKIGLGKRLLHHIEKESKKKAPVLLWFNARTTAVDFYKKEGFLVEGKEFNMNGVGPHFLMYKYYE